MSRTSPRSGGEPVHAPSRHGQGEEPSPRHRAGPWYPVIPVEMVPTIAGGDIQLTYDTADVYGINIQSTGWYVKLCIDHDTPEVAVISFHPPEHPMRTPAGV